MLTWFYFEGLGYVRQEYALVKGFLASLRGRVHIKFDTTLVDNNTPVVLVRFLDLDSYNWHAARSYYSMQEHYSELPKPDAIGCRPVKNSEKEEKPMSRKTIAINTDDYTYTYLSLSDIYKNLGIDQPSWEYAAKISEEMYNRVNKSFGIKSWKNIDDKIKRVIFNAPATIILWKDGTKTVVKCGENEEYDPEKGLAMALVKHFLGNKGNYNNLFRKYLKEVEE